MTSSAGGSGPAGAAAPPGDADRRLPIGQGRFHRRQKQPRHDAEKKINGRKRHITVDTLGLPVMITVTPADVQDGDAARDVF
ncbi:transposase [Streptomyces sp. NPDC088551]|uniref:transposase n=1 Tax=Streptomyces sp. NPDC088551 TaxID=3365863 RepID=UPI00380BED07